MYKLNQLHVPEWFRTFVRNSLRDVRAYPDLGYTPIHIGRGVKQGCPLSPLIFILCYEPLIRQLATHTHVCAAADDIALQTDDLEALQPSIQAIHTFRDISGLGVNTDKTRIMPVWDVDEKVKNDFIDRCAWKDVKFTDKYTYLGVPFGPHITAKDIYTLALDKVRKRCKRLRSTISRFDLDTRIIIFNVFIIPIFSYLYTMFLMPYEEIIEKFHTLIRHHIIPWGPKGGGFHHYHLYFNQSRIGTKQPLKDLWALNLAAMLKGKNLEPMSKPEPRKDKYIVGARISTHRARAAEYARLWLDPHHNLAKLNTTTKMYRALIHHGWKNTHDDYISDKLQNILIRIPNNPDIIETTTTKHKKQQKPARKKPPPPKPSTQTRYSLRNRKPTPQQQQPPPEPSPPSTQQTIISIPDNILKPILTHHLNHLRSVPSSLPPKIHRHHLLTFTNALNTDIRLRHYIQPTTTYCHLCKKHTDDIIHIYNPQQCIFTNNIIQYYAKHHKHLHLNHLRLLDDNAYHPLSFLLNFPTSKTTPPTAAFILVANWAIWKCRIEAAKGMETKGLEKRCIERIEQFSKQWQAKPEKKREARRKKQAESAEALIKQVQELEPTVIFTDGSAYGNPGPSGAGAVILEPRKPPVKLFEALGTGTNNIGEAWAIGMAFNYLSDVGATRRVAIFSDSSYCQGALEHGHKSKDNKALFRALRRQRNTAAFTSTIYWTPGHMSIEGNEVADELANLGSTTSIAESTASPSSWSFSYRLHVE